jgi:hypothetical protein
MSTEMRGVLVVSGDHFGKSCSAGDLAHFRFRRHSGPCPDLPMANPVANGPEQTLDVWPHLRFGRPWELSRTTAGAVMLPSPSKPRNCSA